MPSSSDDRIVDSLVSAGVSLDTSLLPLDERAQRRILDHVIAVGDEAESTFLEVKSSLDVTSKLGVAKIAKFLLGAANRRPHQAARHFHGYAVLVIGAQKGSTPGMARGIEAHELEDRLRAYLGPQFPAFELGRLSVDADREVLFIIAQPPRDGQAIFPCHKNYQGEDRRDNLDDGAIYVRGASNTRPARAGEVLTLVERARGGRKPPINLDVEVLGSIGRVARVDEMITRLYEWEEDKFNKTEAPPEPPPAVAVLASLDFPGGAGPLSPRERAQRLEAWRSEKSAHMARGRRHFFGVVLKGVGIKVISHDRFISKPHLLLTFHECDVFDHLEADDAAFREVVEPVLQETNWHGLNMHLGALRPITHVSSVSWQDADGDTTVALTPDSFRPNVAWTTDQDDFVVLARNEHVNTVTVTWVLTEEGHDTATTGELEVPLGNLVDAVDLFSAAFLNIAESAEEDDQL